MNADTVHNDPRFGMACDALRRALFAAYEAGAICDDTLDDDDLSTLADREAYSAMLDDLRDRVGVDTDNARALLASVHGDRVRFVIVRNDGQYLTASEPGRLGFTASYPNAYTFADGAGANAYVEHVTATMEPVRAVMVTVRAPTLYGHRG